MPDENVECMRAKIGGKKASTLYSSVSSSTREQGTVSTHARLPRGNKLFVQEAVLSEMVHLEWNTPVS